MFRPDGVTLATARNDNAIGLGIPHSGEMFVTRRGHNNTVNDVAFSNQRKKAARKKRQAKGKK